MSKWQIVRVHWDTVDEYLEDGYEPFAVNVSVNTIGAQVVEVFLKRQKTE